MIEMGAQIRAARALLNWTRADLAKAAGLHRNAVGYWEGKEHISPKHHSGHHSGPRRITDAFAQAGVTFIEEPGPGICFTTRRPQQQITKRGGMCAEHNFAPLRAGAHVHHGVLLMHERRSTLGEMADRLADQRYEQFKAARSAAWGTRRCPPRVLTEKQKCGAKTRRGTACLRKALANGRCPNHGGLSTGPKTEAGRQRIAEAQRRRWAKWAESRTPI